MLDTAKNPQIIAVGTAPRGLSGTPTKAHAADRSLSYQGTPLNTIQSAFREGSEMSSFKPWLLKQTKRKDAVGDLARDAMNDKTWPKYAKLPELYGYLKNCDACEGALDTLRVAWREHQISISENGRIPLERWGLTPKPQMTDEDRARLARYGYEQIPDKKPASRHVSLKLRYEILKRDGFKCRFCGQSARTGAVLEIDHIIPVAAGGDTIESNLQCLCFRCNRGKSDDLL